MNVGKGIRIGVRSAVLTAAILGSSSIAHAQATQKAELTDGAEDGQADIVVTAQKKREMLLSVPVPVSVVMPSALLSENRTQLQDYFTKIPSLSLLSSGSGQTTIAIRGISTSSSSNPTVGIVIDDVPFGASSVTAYSSRLIPDLDPSDLARVEVLRGPQGTLYGASSMGGLLKYVTADPSTAGFSGRVQADTSAVQGGQLGYGVRGMVNIPLGNDLAMRVSGFGRHDPGYVENVTTGERNVNSGEAYGGRVSLLWSPSEDVNWKVSGLLQNSNGNGTAEVDVNSNFTPTIGDLDQTRMPQTGNYESRIRLVTSTVSADLGFASVAFLTGFGRSEYRATYDTSPSYGPFVDLILGTRGVTGATLDVDYATNKFTQEVRLSRSFGDHVDVIVGGYYGNERTKGRQVINANQQNTGDIAGNLATITSRTKLDELAGFGAVTLHFGGFSIQAGGRYAQNDQSYPRVATGPLVGPSSSDIHAKSSLGTFLITPQYKFNENVMIYGRVASGYRIGGPNPNAAAGAPSSYAPDKTINYEVGLKGSFLNRVLTLDTSLFYIDWNDIQLSLSNPTTGLTYFTNGPKAKSEGVEASMTLAPITGFTVTANGSYNVAELTENLPAGGGYGLDGDRLPFSSRFSGSVSADGRVPLTETADLTAGLTVTYVGDRYGDFQRSATQVRPRYPSYTTVDLRLGVENGPWTLSGFVSNASNERGIIGGSSRGLSSSATSPFAAVYIRPRTFGVSVAAKF